MIARFSATFRLALCTTALVVGTGAYADTAAPFTSAFGRLIDPSAPVDGTATTTLPGASDALPLTGDVLARRAAIDCLALAITYEAGHEPLAGQAAVAQVIVNRVRHPAFPKSVCAVVYQGAGRHTGCQFSFVCDGSLARRRNPQIWTRAQGIAAAVLDGERDPVVGTATFYHANYVSPYWAPALVRVATIGAHIFYRFPGAAIVPPGSVPAATNPPARREPAFAPWGLNVAVPSEESM